MSKYLNFAKGVYGENLAVKYLKKKRFKIIEKNFKTYTGEIDIIAYKNKIYHIIEVKYRKNNDFGYPREAVNREKQAKIRRTAEAYFAYKNIIAMVNFDVIEIIGEEINLIERAF